MWHSVIFESYLPTCCSLRLQSRVVLVVRLPTSTQPFPLDVTLEQPPGAWARRRTRGQLCTRGTVQKNVARRTRINEAGDAAPGSQDSTTRRVRNLQLPDTLAMQTTRSDPAPPPTPNSRTPAQPRSHRSLHWKYRSWSHDAHGSEARVSAADTRKCGSASTARSGSLRILCTIRS